MRYETFEIPGESPIELAVSTFPESAKDETTFLLANINRWRGAIELAPIGAESLAGMHAQLPLADGTATLVSLVGKLKRQAWGPQVALFLEPAMASEHSRGRRSTRPNALGQPRPAARIRCARYSLPRRRCG